MRYPLRIIGLTLVVMVLNTSASLAGKITSEYSKINLPDQTGALTNCIDIIPHGAGEEIADNGKWTCNGYKDWLVDVAYGDGRYSLYFRPDSAPVTDSWQSLSGFHTIGKTLEWRLEDDRPFAAILRHYLEWDGVGSGIRKSQMLVVWKVSISGSCHVAYIDVRGKGNANVKARQAADTLARGFDCTKDEITYIGPAQ